MLLLHPENSTNIEEGHRETGERWQWMTRMIISSLSLICEYKYKLILYLHHCLLLYLALDGKHDSHSS